MNIPYLSLQAVTNQHAEEIQQAVKRVVDSGWYLLGEEVKAFEKEFANYTESEHCIGCANGLDALTMILRGYIALGRLTEGDEVLVPANTYIASILAISECRLKPVLLEPKLSTFLLDDNEIERHITSKTKAIMLVHLYGYNAYTEKIGMLCREKSLLLIEDCAQAHGNVPPHKDIEGACAYSFYPGKNLGALGDGGCITTHNEHLAHTVRSLCNYGSSEKYVFDHQGRNSRLDEIQAAVLRVKLRYLDRDNNRRRQIADRYISEIKNSSLTLPPRDGVFHIFPMLCSNRDKTQDYLSEKGIGTMIHYPIPPHKQKAYTEWNSLSLPITEKIHREELSLPCNQTMTDDEVTYVIDSLNAMK